MEELVVKRYGQALFEIVKESDDFDTYEEQIRQMHTILKQEPEFIDVLCHPKVSSDEKIQLIERVFGEKVQQDLVGFLVLAVNKSRQNNILDILSYTIDTMDEYKGYVKAYVTSAVELTDQNKQDITKKLEEQTKMKVNLVTQLDHTIIGGIQIRIKDRIVDNSIKTSLHRMSQTVYEA
jgi:F-type H+-transporting ATPase subunit delta